MGELQSARQSILLGYSIVNRLTIFEVWLKIKIEIQDFLFIAHQERIIKSDNIPDNNKIK